MNTKESHASIHVPPKLNIQREPNIQWIIWGVMYTILVVVLDLPAALEFFPVGSIHAVLFIWPIWGITYMLRDAVQYAYENTAEKREKSSGFWPSMLFVGLGVLGNLWYAPPLIMWPAILSIVTAGVVDGIIFSLTKRYGLGYRLLFSNIGAAIFDSGIFLFIMTYFEHTQVDIQYQVLTASMEVFPAFVAFILGTTIFAKALGVVDFGIGRRINRG